MFDAKMKIRTGSAAKRLSGSPYYRPVAALAAVAAIALLAGCTMPHTDSVTVGAIPDDYRTNHPIIIAEKEQSVDIPVGSSDRGATKSQRILLGGFLSDYDRSAAPVVNILVPVGTVNELAASHAGRDFIRIARANGVPKGRIVVSSYQPLAAESSAPIRVSYTAVAAHTDKCGRWPEDLVQSDSATENRHYADFGCSSQNNLAAQIANPSDLIGPRKQTEIDAENRGNVIDEYRKTPDGWSPSVDY